MKRLILSIALVATTFVLAQKKEIAAAIKAIDAGDTATANQQITTVDGLIGDKTYMLEPSLLEQYYYAKGISLIKSGKTTEGAGFLAKIADLGKSKIFTGKDASKNRVYYVGKVAADASGLQNLKEETYQLSLTEKLRNLVNPILQEGNKVAMDAYNAKKYSEAAPKFSEVYNLLKVVGQDNKQYLYYSAITYAMADNKPKAIEVYSDLINSGYTGVETTYTGKNKKSGQVESMDKNSWELMKKMGDSGDYTDYKVETSKSVEQELYDTLVALLMEDKQFDKAIEVSEKGLKKFPNNVKLNELKGVAYYRSGKTEEYISNLKDIVAKNPTDKTSWYNLGVLASKDPAKFAESESYFKKAIEIDPAYKEAYQNLAIMNMDLDNDSKYIDQYNNLRKSGKIADANKIIAARRVRFTKALPYAEKLYSLDNNNLEAVSLLKGLYQSTQNDAKYNEFKAKETALQKK